jgi:hypothetical protein
MLRRRGLLAGLGALLAAPAIIRTPGLLMPVRPVVEPLALVGVGMGRDDGVLVFFSTPSGRENGVFWQAWMDAAKRDIGRVTGINDEMLGGLERERSSVTIETQRRLLFGDWPVGNSEVS